MSAAAETMASPAEGPVAPAKRSASDLATKYRTFCYRLLGDRLEGGSEVLAERLRRAGESMPAAMYSSMSWVTSFLAAGLCAAVSVLLFRGVLHETQWYLYVVMLTLIGISATAAGFRFRLDTEIANRKDRLERELPFTLSELSVLASTGTSPIRLVRRMAQRDHDPAMTETFRQVVYRTDIEGKDLISALAETAKESPSNPVRDTLWDLANMIHQGGNLDEYLRSKSDAVLQLKRLVQKEFIERLSTFLDMYVSLVLVGVLMIAVAAFLLNALGSTAAGLDANELLLLLTFGLVPLAVGMTIIMVSIAYARAE